MNFSFVINSIENVNMDNIIREFSDIFKDELGCYKQGKVHLEIEAGAKPIFCRPRKVPLAFVEGVNKEIDRLVEEGVLVQVTDAQWGTPIVPVLKKDSKEIRVCVDYKTTINPHLKDYKVPLPNIDEIFSKLNGGVYFTKLDLKNAYNQLELDEESQMLTAWSTHKGVFKCTRMPFGAKVSCAHFQSIMDKILLGCKGTACFYDDILITGTTVSEHLSNLREVFRRLSDAGLRLNLKKCVFFQDRVIYLGRVIDKEGLRKDKGKVKAIIYEPRSTDVVGVQSYIGLINYYGHFFPQKSSILAPFHKLLEKNSKFEWTKQCEIAYQLTKEIVASDRVLVHYNPEWPVVLVCDASQYGVGAAIFHVLPDKTEKPIAFASKTLLKAQRNYSTIDREALAIFFGVNKFSHYLKRLVK